MRLLSRLSGFQCPTIGLTYMVAERRQMTMGAKTMTPRNPVTLAAPSPLNTPAHKGRSALQASSHS